MSIALIIKQNMEDFEKKETDKVGATFNKNPEIVDLAKKLYEKLKEQTPQNTKEEDLFYLLKEYLDL
jgi:hypothetical protein